jgi:hypothetical protein
MVLAKDKDFTVKIWKIMREQTEENGKKFKHFLVSDKFYEK